MPPGLVLVHSHRGPTSPTVGGVSARRFPLANLLPSTGQPRHHLQGPSNLSLSYERSRHGWDGRHTQTIKLQSATARVGKVARTFSEVKKTGTKPMKPRPGPLCVCVAVGIAPSHRAYIIIQARLERFPRTHGRKYGRETKWAVAQPKYPGPYHASASEIALVTRSPWKS